jgi:hypothetical protein
MTRGTNIISTINNLPSANGRQAVTRPFELELGGGHVALVDLDDYLDLADFRWHACPAGNTGKVQAARYVTIDGKRRLSYLHNEIMQPPEGSVVVFRNRNRLDCRRSNLFVVPKELAHKFRPKRIRQIRPKGLKYDKQEKRWSAEIELDGVLRPLGKFRCQAEAILAQIRAEEEHAAQLQPGKLATVSPSEGAPS